MTGAAEVLGFTCPHRHSLPLSFRQRDTGNEKLVVTSCVPSLITTATAAATVAQPLLLLPLDVAFLSFNKTTSLVVSTVVSVA